MRRLCPDPVWRAIGRGDADVPRLSVTTSAPFSITSVTFVKDLSTTEAPRVNVWARDHFPRDSPWLPSRKTPAAACAGACGHLRLCPEVDPIVVTSSDEEEASDDTGLRSGC